MDTWTDAAVRDLEIELKRLDLDADTKRAAAEAAQAAYDAVMAEQTTVRQMLEWTLTRRAQRVEEPARMRVDVAVPQIAATASPKHSDLCMQVLTQIGYGPLVTPAEVRARLQQAGYDLKQDQVRSALKYLARKKNAPLESVRPGVFRLRGTPGYATLESAMVPAVNGYGGSP